MHELVISGEEVGVDEVAQFQYRQQGASGSRYVAVVDVDDMEYDVVVGRVSGVLVEVPVGGVHVDLDRASPAYAAYGDAGVQEVGAGGGVQRARRVDGDRPSVDGGEGADEEPVEPEELEEGFGHINVEF